MYQRKSISRILLWAEPAGLILTPCILAAAVAAEFEQTALLSLIVISVAMLPFFARFEQRRPKPRDIVPIVVMSVIAAIGRTLLVVFPNVQPVTAIVIISGIAFGPQAGFLTGALSALSSNLFLGQGPWTPWQMFGWGLTGYAAGHFQKRGLFSHPLALYVFGLVVSFLFGALMNVWVVIGFVRPFAWEAALTVYLTSIYVDILHAGSTVVFLLLMARPWLKKLERVKNKYGLFSDLV